MTALTTNQTAAPSADPETKGLRLPWACIASIAAAVQLAQLRNSELRMRTSHGQGVVHVTPFLT